MLNIDAVKNHIKYFRENKYDREFYIALLMYDVLDYNESDVTQDIIDTIYDVEGRYEYIYKQTLRDELRGELEIETEIEEEIEI